MECPEFRLMSLRLPIKVICEPKALRTSTFSTGARALCELLFACKVPFFLTVGLLSLDEEERDLSVAATFRVPFNDEENDADLFSIISFSLALRARSSRAVMDFAAYMEFLSTSKLELGAVIDLVTIFLVLVEGLKLYLTSSSSREACLQCDIMA